MNPSKVRAAAPVKAPFPDLGPNQLAWLAKNVPSFDRAWKSAEAAKAHSEQVRLDLARGSKR